MVGTRKRKLPSKEPDVEQSPKKKRTTKKSETTIQQQNQPSTEIAPTTSNTDTQQSLSTLIHEPSWSEHLQDLFDGDNFKSIENFLNGQWSAGKVTYPPKHLIFEAFNKTPFDQVKVVLLGQDPYHDDGQVRNALQQIISQHILVFLLLGAWFGLFCTENNYNITTVLEKHL